tara:strand:+ start:698 stop:1576 length:879 start_codon:yes stop_codon:yes gene_type:complete
LQAKNSKIDKVWRIIDLINWGEKYLKEKSIENPKIEIELFLQHLLKCKRIDLYLQFETIVKPENLAILRKWITRRINYEPIQYILGSSEFYGRPFIVNKNVLIPRPETEILIDISIEELKNVNNPTILDIGTGSGCIAITVALEIPLSTIIAIDIDERAISVAKNNVEKHGVKNIEFIITDIFHEKINRKVDMLISNPPYIAKEEVPGLMKDVKDYEPLIALTDNNDGLMFYRKIAEIMPSILKENGTAIVEVGIEDHPNRVENIFRERGFDEIKKRLDLNKDTRAIVIKNK